MSALDLLGHAYLITLGVLAILGLHRLHLVALSLRARGSAPVEPHRWPTVTVQLPVYNERYVVERLLASVGSLRYPPGRLQIQVLDDSDDDTAQRVASAVQRLRAAGVDVVQVRRGDRRGYKAGALQHGLATATGELVCIFDADFVPDPDFLLRTVPAFDEAGVGMVQARWGHLNGNASWLTRTQAMMLDAHFLVEHPARQHAGRFFNFNGTAGIWRRAAVDDAGGWQSDTLTEDLDLSYRAQLRGWRFRYAPDVQAPAELPANIDALKGQQRRWTQGAMQTARKLLGNVWRSELPLPTKLEATAHLGANLAYPLMLMLSLLAPVALAARQLELIWTPPWWIEILLFLAATGSVCVFFLVAEVAAGGSLLRTVLRLPALLALGAGLAVNNTVAVWRGLVGRTAAFVRTPKFGGLALLRYRDERPALLDGVLVLELVLTVWSAAALAAAVRDGTWWSLPLVLLFLVGYGHVALATMRDRWRSRREAGAGGC